MKDIKLIHGGDWVGFKNEYGKAPLDFSMNVNPMGVSGKVEEAIAGAAADAYRYPDPLCRELREKIAEAEDVSPDHIFCGNGAADIIFRLAKLIRDGKVMVTAPSFSEYESALASEGSEVEHYILNEAGDFMVEASILDRINDEICALFLCEPNNPTGVTTDRDLLKQIIGKCRQNNIYIIADECFNGFLDNPDEHTLKDELGSCDRLIILKAFTKLWGMAGVRLGYCLCSSTEFIEALYGAGAPWNVSSLAQAAGIAALDDTEHVEKGREIIRGERKYLMDELRTLGISKVYGEANYLLFRDKRKLCSELKRKGILIRSCHNYIGLSEGWYRIAVKTHVENEELIAAMKEIRGAR